MRVREIVRILQTLVAQPEQIETDLVRRDRVGTTTERVVRSAGLLVWTVVALAEVTSRTKRESELAFDYSRSRFSAA